MVKQKLLRFEVFFLDLDRNPDTLGDRVRKGLERMRDRQTEAEEGGKGRWTGKASCRTTQTGSKCGFVQRLFALSETLYLV